MRKILLLNLLVFYILFLGGCSLTNKHNNKINSGEIENLTQLEQELNGIFEQFSGLQAENESLKESLSGAISILKTLKEENEKLKNQKIIIENKINESNTDKKNVSTQNNNETITRNRYNSSLGFSMILPGECIDGVTIKEGPPYSIYHRMQDLNYSGSNNKSISCFLPDQNNMTSILGLLIHDHICDMENSQHYQGEEIQFGNNHFIFYTLQSLEGSIYKCYKTNYNNQILRFTFSRGYTDSLIQTILESIDSPI